MTMADSCREVLDDLERYLDGECSSRLEAIISQHLADCTPCLSRSDFERALREMVARHCQGVAPAGLVDRVMERLS